MGEIDHADDAEHHGVADGDEAVDRAERNPVDELLDEDFHAPSASLRGNLPAASAPLPGHARTSNGAWMTGDRWRPGRPPQNRGPGRRFVQPAICVTAK